MTEQNGRKKILIIDDDPVLTKMLETRLSAVFYDTVVAQNGEEGLAKYQKEKPDLIILDISMPKMDGFTFVQEFKKISNLQKTPIIMLTANESMEEVFRVEGINDYIVKPFQMEKLLEKIQKHLSTPEKRILVVDDALEAVDLLEGILSDRGYQISKAVDGLSGLSLAKREIPDLMILDVMMPKLDGLHVCRIIKYDERFKRIAVILLTAKGENQDKLLGQEVGADVYLEKPLVGDVLLQKIKELLWD